MQADILAKPATHSLIASDRVEGTAVRRSNCEKIGVIERIMIDKVSGKVAYAVLSFGGFLGMGKKHLPVPWSRLTFNSSPGFDAYEVNLTDEEISKAPFYSSDKNFDWGDRERERELHTYYKVPPYWGI